ncbi:SNF2-related protein [Pantoea sp. CCBC3-3-1]|uniref:SNF2-related protein n=1 Tax=Pantoea sp. CCBC3-3-1 TaxID=2490851 RepID=UPI0011BF9723|nr:SNF2-related protein [Pantoea sp. CCBC3-3-1]
MPGDKGRYSETIEACNSVSDIVRFIRSLAIIRKPVAFGVTKVAGVSIERTRKEANQKALELLNTLSDGVQLTDEQRQTLAGYTGEGGIGGSTHEYYTPQHVAEGMWDLMKLYGADVGNTLEPSAGAGVFNETKPKGTLITAAEISQISGRINQLLHPEDNVKVAPFEMLASGTPDNSFDHCIGNVPFGDARGDTINLDKAYTKEKDIGRYFILRLLDKIKPGGIACIIVPYGMTSGSRMKKLREQVSRKAEFLGAHRLPSGTFEENGTSTAVDVWVLKKHPEALADMIMQADEPLLTAANVLWPEYILGKWFDQDGKRFVYGETEKGFQGRLIIRNDQITFGALKEKLIHKFDSRIDWNMLNISEPQIMKAAEGEQRLINGQWYVLDGGQWVLDVSGQPVKVEPARYGISDMSELKVVLDNPESLLARKWDHIEALVQDYPHLADESARKALDFAGGLPVAQRERIFRGALLGNQIGILQDAIANKYPADYIDSLRQSTARLVESELKTFGNPNQGRISKVSGNNSGGWLKFRASITSDGQLSDLLQGTLSVEGATAYDSTSHEQVVRHLFNQIDLVPISLQEFRSASTAVLPDDDNALLDILANTDGIALTPSGDLIPMDRATSGDIGIISGELNGVLGVIADGPQKNNYLRQLEQIKARRKWTGVDDITFSLDSRWFDRSLVLEFLHEAGYDDLTYVQSIEVENGALVSEQGYRGANGVFAGYRYGTVLKKDKETNSIAPTYARKSTADGFSMQLEKYLNGGKPAGVNGESYIARIRDLETEFNNWIRQHDEIDSLVEQYNNAFNAYIPFEQSESSLGLKGISGERVPFSYQNQEVRRLSEDGRGILGFGTGLGKTTTALALEAYNFENGRSTRTAIVVPKAVYENWYHEAKGFYSADAFANILFIGLDLQRDDAGNARQVPVLDESGQPKLDAGGAPVTRDALTLSSSATIKARMNQIPHSNNRLVVMSKEQYAAIPMRPETIRDHAHDVLFAQADAGRVKIGTDSYREQKKKDRVLTEYSDTGTVKEHDFPYFEDMHFDSVIADEGHNYRNSYSAGREASQLAYLPVPSVSQSARDMAVKNAYLMAKNNGRGPVLLTATPVVNSPIDAFNMLSHCVSMEDWHRMGIFTPDDFVKEFGRTKLCEVMKLSGEVELKQGLIGFKNLDGLRGIFHRWTTLKTAADVAEQVKIPDLVESTAEAPMSPDQFVVYEELRERAEKLSKGQDDDEDPENKDTIFGIIRDMDRVCTDMDLYNRVITFRFPAALSDKVRQLVADLPDSVGADSDNEEEYGTAGQYTVREEGEFCTLVVPEMYEPEVLKRMSKFGIADQNMTHPLTPKYSALVENLKAGLKRGKQIIFTDEKSQHGKLRRILVAQLGIDESQIGILNATTVANAGKKGKKPKKVKPPKNLPDEPTEEQVTAYYQQKLLYDDYVAVINEVSLGGLEQIAADYNEGRSRVLICNKKAEVGINLHKGTTDIHHLTLPWTPASIDQRNGRGARVGSSQDSVNVFYYCGSGSFDEFRLRTLKRKKNWIKEILTSDKSQMDNADAGNMVEMQLLLAANPEERERRIAEQVSKAKAAATARAKVRATQDLGNYIKAQHAGAANLDTERGKAFDLDRAAENAAGVLDKVRRELTDLQQGMMDAQEKQKEEPGERSHGYRIKRIESEIRTTREFLTAASKADINARSAAVKQQRKIERLSKAESEIKRLRPVIKKALDDGLLDVDPDVLDHGKDILLVNGKTYKVGQIYNFNVNSQGKYNAISYARISGLDFDARTADLIGLFTAEGQKAGSTKNVPVEHLGTESDVTLSELELLSKMQGGMYIQAVPELLSKEQFYHYLKMGQLMLNDGNTICYEQGKYSTVVLNRRSAGYGLGGGVYRDSNWYRDNGQKLIYPDRSDEQLKQAIAIKERQKADFRYSCKGFLTALFGGDWETVMAGIGEIAGPDVINAAVARRMSGPMFSYEKDFHSSVSKFIATGEVEVPKLAGMRFLSGDIPAQYTNSNDFESALKSAILSANEEAREMLVSGKAQRAQADYEQFGREVEQGVLPSETQVLRVLDGYGTIEQVFDGYSSYQSLQMCAAVVILGLADASAVTADLLTNPAGIRSFAETADVRLQAMNEPQANQLKESYQIKRGLITPEDIAQRKELEEARTKSTLVVEKMEDNTGIEVRINTSNVRNKRGINFSAGGCFGLRDPKGKEGALFRAKDELKDKYGAKFLNSWKDNSEFPGSWWLIPSKYDQEEVLKVVAKY